MWGQEDINEIITYHTNLNPCSFKGNLPLHNSPVHNTASGKGRENVITINQTITCSFKGNLQSVNRAFHSTVKWGKGGRN